MEFRKFNSLENTYRQNLIDKVVQEGKSGGEWVVTEKVDGSNLSFWCDGDVVRVASRTQFVDGTFFNCQSVIDRYKQGILDYCNRSGIRELVIYGELFGDRIQNRVKYGEKDFLAFDVVMDGQVLDKKSSLSVAEGCKIPFSPPLFVGGFKECLEYEETFQSRLTPPDHKGKNFAEGVVIEPVVPTYLDNGSRIYFKKKSPEFKERGAKQKIQQSQTKLTGEEVTLLEEVLSYNTSSRVVSVISKIGIITNKDFGKILGLTIQDMLEDYEKDSNISLKERVGDSWKMFSKELQSHVISVVREEFVKHIE